MMYAVSLDENNRILSATFEAYADESYVIVNDLPDGNISDYLYQNGEYIYDPLPEPEPEPDREPTADEILNALLGVNA
jgi:hypothetical protein